MRRARDLCAAAVVTITFGVVLAACSSGGSSTTASTTTSPTTNQTASEIAAASKAAMLSLSSVHVVGVVPSGGQRVAVNLTLTSSTSAGTFGIGGGALQVLVNGTTVYAMGTEGFWANTVGTPTAIAALLANKWVTGIPGTATSGLTSSLNLQSFINSIFNDVTLTKGPTTTVAGQSAIPLTGSDGSVGYVAAQGTPYLLKVTAGNSTTKGTLVLSQFNTAIPPAVPTNAVNFSTGSK